MLTYAGAGGWPLIVKCAWLTGACYWELLLVLVFCIIGIYIAMIRPIRVDDTKIFKWLLKLINQFVRLIFPDTALAPVLGSREVPAYVSIREHA
jgi:hypothetical protein